MSMRAFESDSDQHINFRQIRNRIILRLFQNIKIYLIAFVLIPPCVIFLALLLDVIDWRHLSIFFLLKCELAELCVVGPYFLFHVLWAERILRKPDLFVMSRDGEVLAVKGSHHLMTSRKSGALVQSNAEISDIYFDDSAKTIFVQTKTFASSPPETGPSHNEHFGMIQVEDSGIGRALQLVQVLKKQTREIKGRKH